MVFPVVSFVSFTRYQEHVVAASLADLDVPAFVAVPEPMHVMNGAALIATSTCGNRL